MEQQPTVVVNTCATSDKALAIAGLIMGVLGLAALGFAIWNIRRRRAWGSKAERSSPRSNISSDKMKSGGGFIERWWNGLVKEPPDSSRVSSPQEGPGGVKAVWPTRARAPPKESIFRSIWLNIWPNRWRPNDDRLSFQDIGIPTMPGTTTKDGRVYM